MESVMNKEVVTSSIKVKVISTTGVNKKVVEVDPSITTWGDLKRVFNTNNVSFKDMNVVIGESNVTLELDEAKLPTTDFTLFILPKKVKSGASKNYTKAQLDAVQKTFASKKGAAVCAAKLNISVEDYINMKNILKGKPVVAAQPIVTPIPKPIVEAPVVKGTILDRLNDLYEDLLLELDENDDTMVELQSIIDDYSITSSIDTFIAPKIESEAEKALRLDREETEQLLAQAKSLQSKLNK